MNHSTHTLWTLLAIPRHGITLVALIIGALGIGSIALGVLCNVPVRFRKSIVAGVTFVSGLFLTLEFLIPKHNILTDAMPTVANLEIVIGCFALTLGLWNLFHIHGKAVSKRTPGWYNSIAFFVSFFAIMIFGFLKDKNVAGTSQLFDVLFFGLFMSLKSTMFSLVAFYIVSAAYGAFRIRSAEAVLMMVAAAIIMLALVPIGTILTSWLPKTGILSAFRLERIGYWLLLSPNMAVQRAIAFGVGVGALATGLRIWLSLERGSYYDRQL